MFPHFFVQVSAPFPPAPPSEPPPGAAAAAPPAAAAAASPEAAAGPVAARGRAATALGRGRPRPWKIFIDGLVSLVVRRWKMVEDWEMEDCHIDLVVYYGMLISG